MDENAIGTLHIEGWKSFIRSAISFGRINILLGANGAGKSNLLILFEFLAAVYQNKAGEFLEQYGGLDAILSYGTQKTRTAVIDIELFGTSCRLTLDSSGITVSAPLSSAMEQLGSLMVYRFRDSKAMTVPQDPTDNRILHANGSNTISYLYRIQRESPKYYARIIQTIQFACPGFRDFIFREEDSRLNVCWNENSNPAYCLPLATLSGGTLRYIALATLLLQPSPPKLILIDEPELGLHPYTINTLADLLHMSAGHSQIVASTQSIQLINHFQPDDIILIDSGTDGATLHRPDTDELHDWLAEYTLGDIWQKNLIGGNP